MPMMPMEPANAVSRVRHSDRDNGNEDGQQHLAHLCLTTENKHFQPMGANMGILPPLPEESRPRDKRLRYMAQAQRAVASFQHWLDETSL